MLSETLPLAYLVSFVQTRMVHSKPYELLLPEEKLSKASEKMITHFTQYEHCVFFLVVDDNTASARNSNADWSNPDHKIRTERIKHSLSYTEAFSYLTSFYTDKSKSAVASEGYNSGMSASLLPGIIMLG